MSFALLLFIISTQEITLFDSMKTIGIPDFLLKSYKTTRTK